MYFDLDLFRKRLKAARKKKHYSQEQFAEILNISYSHLSKIEAGTHSPSIDLIIAMALELQVSTDYLLLESGTTNKTIKMRLSAIAQAIMDLVNDL